MNKRITQDREHWSQSIVDLRIRANLSKLSVAEKIIAEHIWDIIPQYRHAARIIAAQGATGYYKRSHKDFTSSLYYWDGHSLSHIATTTRHHIQVIRNHHADYIAGNLDVHPDIWANYCHGGFLTRRGLLANYNQYEVEKMGKVALSHIKITESGKAAHDARVSIR